MQATNDVLDFQIDMSHDFYITDVNPAPPAKPQQQTNEMRMILTPGH